MKDLKSLGLIPEILKALKSKGYTHPTPIQEQSIPTLLEGKDLIGIAQTGTGKTASFLLPIIQKLAKSRKQPKPNRMCALILTPTRELASQIEENMVLYSNELSLSSTVIFGGVKPRPQIREMKKGQHVLVATPGRLLDLMEGGHIFFDQLEFFVLDEADRMLDMGFIHDVKKIIKKLPEKKQTVLFSATMSKDIKKLAEKLQKNPVQVEVTPEATTVEKIQQSVVKVEKRQKPLLLQHLIRENKVLSALVFSKTKHGCDRIVKNLLAQDISAAAIHGNKSQNAREKALNSFREQKVQVLVATDIAARGIDIPHVGHVFNSDIPRDPNSYVHRIGRTARAGREGIAIAFCDVDEASLLKSVEKLIKYNIPVDPELGKLAKTLKPLPSIRKPTENRTKKTGTKRSGSSDHPAKKRMNRKKSPGRKKHPQKSNQRFKKKTEKKV
ncbi:MAG: DEAD/DEAH box helicase [Halobacteriovoraceae bacterium]|nr:DEAD/DEAH box helicase [Halobacteriovoraceae bacterium]